MLSTQVLKINPDVASKMLQANINNRPLSSATIDAYAYSMKRGEWMLNGETMTFSEGGRLIDGQHRLHAVIKSGVEIDALVVTGADERAFETHGQTRRRSNSDVLAISGEKNYTVLAAAARFYVAYKQGMHSAESRTISAPQVLACIEKHPELRYWATRFSGSKNVSKMSSALVAYLTVASELYGVDKLDKFFDKLHTGTNLAQGDPALLLRERLLNQGVAKLTRTVAQAFMVKAINAHIHNKKISILRHKAGEEFPQIK